MRIGTAVATLLLCAGSLSLFAATRQFDSSVVAGSEPNAYVCSASLLEIPSRVTVFTNKVHTVAGDTAVAVSGEQSADLNGVEYRLTCSIDDKQSEATVQLKVSELRDGAVGAFSVHESRVRLRK
jgi:hypothetical protein